MEKDADYFRGLSQKIDTFYHSGMTEKGERELEKALREAQGVSQTYRLFFEGELEGYVEKNHSMQENLFRRAVNIEPKDFFLLRSLGINLLSQGKLDEAIKFFDRAFVINPNDYESFRYKGMALFNLGDHEGAIKLYDQALAINPKDFESLSHKGIAFAEMGNFEEAIKLYDQALAINPKDCHSLRLKGSALFELGNFEEAIKLYDQALAINSKDCHSLRLKGSALFELGYHKEGIKFFDQALAINAKDYESLRLKGTALFELGNFEEAIKLYDRALAINPRDCQSLSNKGVVLTEQGKEEEAIKFFDQALTINPKDYNSLRFKGVLLGRRGELEEAITFFDQALAINPRDCQSLSNKAAVLAEQGKEEEAIFFFDQALTINPRDYGSLSHKGAFLSNKGKLDEAIRLFDQALAIKPKDYPSLRLKGIALFKQGDFEEAIKLYDQALAINPRDYESLRHKGSALSKQGKLEEALKLYREALAINPRDALTLRSWSVSAFNANDKNTAWEKIFEAYTLKPNIVSIRESYEYLAKYLGKAIAGKKIPSGKDEQVKIIELRAVVDLVREKFKGKVRNFLSNMENTKKRTEDFLKPESNLKSDCSFFLVLRKWNSFTPIIPTSSGEQNVGGGYYLIHKGRGVVVDPGYNFIENYFNAVGRVHDIHDIVLTHAHNDHTMDFESLLSLVYQYNKKNNFRAEDKSFKKIRVFANMGSIIKFSGLLDLRGADYLDRVTVLEPSHHYNLGDGLILNVLPAYHDETVSTKYSVGLEFVFKKDGEGERNIVITSDTGLFPQIKRAGKDAFEADIEKPEIWQKYKLVKENINVLITHLGSIRSEEFNTSIDSNPEEVFYPNHMGILGVARIITSLRPRLALVSEFGEEMKNIREDFINMLREIITEVFPGQKRPKILPADLPFIYEIWKEEVYCVLSNKMVSAEEITFSFPDENTCYYYENKLSELKDKVAKKGDEFDKNRKTLQLPYFVQKP